MLYVLAYSILAIALLDNIVRISRLEFVNYSFRFELFEIRDKLRRALISKEIKKSRWFDYLDSTITKTIDELPHISLWEILLIAYIHRNDKTIKNAQSRLEMALDAEANAFLAEIYKDILNCIVRFILSRHIVLSKTILFIFNSIHKYRNLQSGLAETVMIAPETSTLSQFA